MRLLDVHTYPPPPPPDSCALHPYAILSHVWGEDELVFADLKHTPVREACQSRQKIVGAQAQARKDGLDYIWMDTLCIDKSSSAELSEAINSIYRWYQEAEVCYVYLRDLTKCPPLTDELLGPAATKMSAQGGRWLRESNWFRRGWTLQELIAPPKVLFYDRSWTFIGTLHELAATISNITGIHLPMLQHRSTPNGFSIAQRMSWAAGRETTRPEDRAYSLFGVLDVSVSIRYGEGSRAFTRLQEALIAQTADQTIFAWDAPHADRAGSALDQDTAPWRCRKNDIRGYQLHTLLAPSPDAFGQSHNLVPAYHSSRPFHMTNVGLHITAEVQEALPSFMILNCRYEDDPTIAIVLPLHLERTGNPNLFAEDTPQLEEPLSAQVFPLREGNSVYRLRNIDVEKAHRSVEPLTLYISREPSGSRESYTNWLRQRVRRQHLSSLWLQLLPYTEGSSRIIKLPPDTTIDIERSNQLSIQDCNIWPDPHDGGRL